MKTAVQALAILAAASSVLAGGCGGGGGGGGREGAQGASPLPLPVADVRRARSLTDAPRGRPAETGLQQSRRANSIRRRVDSLYVSSRLSYRAAPGAGGQSLVPANACGGSAYCTHGAKTRGVRELFPSAGSTPSAVLTKHGITLTQHADASLALFGAWLDHSGFAVREEPVGPGRTIPYATRDVYGIAGGDRTGSAPPTAGTAATWRGLMVGRVHNLGSYPRSTVQGDALLTWRDAGGSHELTAAFSNIRNLTHNRAHDTEAFQFTGMTVGADGTFAQGSTGTRIQGAFYGTGHAEAAGVVEHSGIVGAFGAAKQ